MQPVTQYAKSGDVHIAYQAFGEGPINLVLVPGFVSEGQADWRWLSGHVRRSGAWRSLACAIAEEIRSLGIEVRAGLHTGECETIGDDVGGIAVHIGARVAALAGANEVLVSGTVKDLVAGSGLRFGDRGFHALKGIPGEWRIFVAER
jgi:class 3 adenylate cyclase